MQSNKQITDTSKTTVKQALLDAQDNVNALRSSNSGTSFPSDPIAGMHCYRTDAKKMYMYDGSNWVEEVDVNNDQQISGAKTFTGNLEASTVNASTLNISGAATVPTPNADNNSKTVANTAFVKTAIANLVNGAPSQLDTLKELSAALGNDANFSATVAKQIGEKVNKSGDTITGPILYDKTPNDDSELPNKAYVDSAITSKTTSAIDKHNKDGNAHNGILQKVATLGESVLQKLALTTTISAISALQTNSWFGQMLKMVLTASGVKYNIAENGYVCFGAFFGGAIIQWGYSIPVPKDSKTLNITYPVAFSRIPTAIYLTGHGGVLGTLCWISSPNGVSGFAITSEKAGDGSPNSRVSWLAVGS